MALYTAALLTGWIPAERKIDAVGLALLASAAIVIALLVRPDIFARLRQVEWSGFKLDLEKVQDAQARQASELESLRDIIPLLLSPAERDHLVALARGEAQKIKGDHSLRTELRRLRSAGLIRMGSDPAGNKHRIAELKDGEQTYDLPNYIELTPRGERWAKRIRASEADHNE